MHGTLLRHGYHQVTYVPLLLSAENGIQSLRHFSGEIRRLILEKKMMPYMVHAPTT